MTLVFDKSLATPHYRHLLGKKHLNAINGLPVIFKDGDNEGTIEKYFVDGQEYHLYPVHRESCREVELLL
ncbi:hypothetical protein IWT25_00740 [Secundilactobacillus pentosiphilus]|uniref:Uncharacterized protein n=1 Tax=Secundilactobacillus pentosiphilus TaxID=1714682 RepID=A0A1Z5IUS7_9LACO|nr:hypothetical protein [Secundilactobacillus pentosiphilus]GAX05436.1 hypothetical protein IWT25_00740 [Secundilactobacillus pentosiphilus]